MDQWVMEEKASRMGAACCGAQAQFPLMPGVMPFTEGRTCCECFPYTNPAVLTPILGPDTISTPTGKLRHRKVKQLQGEGHLARKWCS